MVKNLDISIYLDFYGEMLTEKQRDYLDYYYNDDLSLSEIARNIPLGEKGRSRQAVRDVIKRAEGQLFEMEERLGLVKKFEKIQSGIDEIVNCANIISENNMKFGLSREINDCAVKIISLANEISEQ